jgi:hypothetical protein
MIDVVAITGRYATDDPEATQLFAQISNSLTTSTESIEVNFEGVTIVSCKFWAYSIARLLQGWDNDTLNQRVSIVGLSSFQFDTLDVVLDNARKFYAKL